MNKILETLESMGEMLIEFWNAVPKRVVSTVAVITLAVFTASPAQAVGFASANLSPVPTDSNPLLAMMGCPSLTWLEPVFPDIQQFTGMAMGFILAAGLVMLVIAVIGITFAGKRTDKVQDGITTAKNVGISWGYIALIPAALLLAWGLITIFNPNCR